MVIAGEDGDAWCRAAVEVAGELGVAVRAVTVGHARGDLRDPRLRWHRVSGIGSTGVVLVRPDRCVAFRSAMAVADPVATLRSVLRAVLSLGD